MNKFLFISLLIFSAFSCNKEYTYDEEAGMETGQAYLLKKARVTDTFAFHLNAEVEMIHFNGYSGDYDYSGDEFSGSDAFGSHTEILSSGIQTPTSNSGYKNLILMNTDNLIWLERYAPGYYLERYLDQVDDDPESAVAIGSYATNNEKEFTLYSQGSNGPFNNSPNFNSSVFYEVTRTTNSGHDGLVPPDDINLKKTIFALDAALDSLNDYAEPGVNLAITLFITGGFNFDELIEPHMNALIAKSADYNIPIHIISNSHNEYDVQIALQTGGFYLASFGCFNASSYERCFDQRVTGQGIVLQNLHYLLRNEYTSHRAQIQMTLSDSTLYPHTPNPFCAINYNNFIFPLVFDKIP